MSNFCSLAGFCTQLTEDLADSDVLACIGSNKLNIALAGDKYSYLVLSDGIECEYVKVRVENGKVVLDERGVGWTTAIDWPKGSRISFQWTDESFAAAYECLQQNDVEQEQCPVKIEGFELVGVDPETGQCCYEPEKDSTLVICDKKYKYTIKGVSFEKEALPADQVLEDGVYTNATITVKDCRMVNVESGSKPLLSGCAPKCNDCDPVEAEPV